MQSLRTCLCQPVYSGKSCLKLPVASQLVKNTAHLDENTQCWLETHQDPSSPLLRAYLQEIQLHLLPHKTPIKVSTVQRFSRHHRKKPNVCLLSPVFTSSLPPLSQSSPPVFAVLFAEPARSDLHAAVQRQPQRLQPHQLPRLLSWSVLPAADRTDQRDGQPGGQRPLAVCGQGLGVLHRGSKGKDVVSLKRVSRKCYF